MKTTIARSFSLVLAAILLLTVSFSALAEENDPVAIDKEAFDALIASGPVAGADTIEASQWAKTVKEAGVLRVGGTRTSFLFSQLDETDNGIRGFDAGLYQLLARYILGDETKFEDQWAGGRGLRHLFHHAFPPGSDLLCRPVLHLSAGCAGQGRQYGNHRHRQSGG